MVISHEHVGTPMHPDWRERLAIGASILGWLLLISVVASQYVGHSSSPYGVCYAASGRSVPCELVKSHR